MTSKYNLTAEDAAKYSSKEYKYLLVDAKNMKVEVTDNFPENYEEYSYGGFTSDFSRTLILNKNGETSSTRYGFAIYENHILDTDNFCWYPVEFISDVDGCFDMYEYLMSIGDEWAAYDYRNQGYSKLNDLVKSNRWQSQRIVGEVIKHA